MKQYFYPAVFTKEENNLISVNFPDIPGCCTSGEGLEEAYTMAQDALCLMLYDMEEDNKTIPAPSDISKLKTEKNECVAIISCDTHEYRRYFDSKAVKKTLSIPSWLNAEAERQGVNFSAILQDALKQRLNINR